MKTDDPTEKDASELHAEEAGVEGSKTEESIASATGAAKKANRAVKDTARKYFDVAGIKVDLEAAEKRIAESTGGISPPVAHRFRT